VAAQRFSTADSRTTTADPTAIPAIVTARIRGIIVCGNGAPRRSARWLLAHST
jgi:hypothetical protein